MNTEMIWILVASRTGARIYSYKTGKGMKPLNHLEFPEGHLRNQDVDSEKPGQVHDSHGFANRNMAPEVDAKMHLAGKWAKQLAEILHRGRLNKDYSRMILVMEPKLLGLVREKLDSPTTSLIALTVEKDLAGISDREVERHLMPVFPLKNK